MTSSRNETLARAIVADCGIETVRSWPIVGGGFVNHVFVVESENQKVVCRFALNPLEKDSFGIEEWCLSEAERVGIPSPKLVRRGHLNGVSYLVQTFVEGCSGISLPPAVAWRELGRCAGLLGRMMISPQAPDELFSRFGRDLHAAWQSHLSYNVAELGPGDPLIALGVYAPPQQLRLRRVIAELGQVDFEFGLSHGDLAPRNLIMSTNDSAVVLDWGSAVTGPVPWGDLETVYRWHVADGSITYQDVECFASGLGLELAKCLPTLEALLILRHLDLIRWALAKRPELTSRYRGLATAGVKRFFSLRD